MSALQSPSRKKKSVAAIEALLDPCVPFDRKLQVVMRLVGDGDDESIKALVAVFDAAAAGNGDVALQSQLRQQAELLEQMREAPLRSAIFFRMWDGNTLRASGLNSPADAEPPSAPTASAGPARAHCLLEDGTAVYPLVVDDALAAELRCGDQVLLDAQGRVVLYHVRGCLEAGEIGLLERRLDNDRVLVSIRDHDRGVLYVTDPLRRALDDEEVKAGEWLLVSPRRMLAMGHVPRADHRGHYRYLVRDPVPNVVVHRDIGAPPAFLKELEQHLRMEMTAPELGRTYGLQRCRMKLLTGVSGSGKTLSIHALWRLMYEIMSEVTGVPLAQLPPRVLHIRSANVLSKWYSESEKQLDTLFDEVEELAAEPFVAPDGRSYELPALVIGEEADGLARARGSDPVHDRVQTTLLQRLDVTSQKLRDRLILFVFSTNVPELCDPAFLRRAGGTIVRFGRLSQRAFGEVLTKHLAGVPLRLDHECTPEEARQRVLSQVLPWLFSPNAQDRGLVQLTYVGATEPETKYRRDFLTGALVARAVQEAAEEARCREWTKEAPRGVTPQQLVAALAAQVQSLVDQLHPQNVHHHVSLPDGVRVGSLRRIPQPKIDPAMLMR